MKEFVFKHHRLLFYLSWLTLGLMQSGLTELLDDEAYYWVYSRYFDWGYYDHPPMTGLLIKMGYAIFPNELGVRLFPLLLNVFSLVIIEKLTVNKNPILFYAIALSLGVLQISGFMAVPDIPLIFFTALFFLLYRNFLNKANAANTLLLGFCIALLMYSKYHAVLIVFFTFLSNIKLVRKYQAWLAVFIAVALFIPHLWWQYEHNWVSFRYHLFESNVNPYKFSYTTEYLLGQLLLAGPLIGFILLPASFLYKPKDKTERALKFTLIGVYAFFFLSSFRGKVEGNWTAPALVPLVILSHQYLLEKRTRLAISGEKLLRWLLPVTLLLVVVARIAMVVDIIPLKAVKARFHSWKGWPAQMREITQRQPVVFSNSYQRASKYWFYSGQTTLSQNWYVNGRNNYNFWPIEDSLIGKPVYFMDINDVWRFPKMVNTPIGALGYVYDSSFVSFMKIKIVASPGHIRVRQGGETTLHCRFEIPDHYSAFIRSHTITNDTVRIGVSDKRKWIEEYEIPTPFTVSQMDRDRQASLTIKPALPKGEYYIRFTIKCGNYNSTHNSEKMRLTVE